MERTVLDILEANIKEAKDEQVANLFRHHHDETQQHVRNLEEAFGLFGWDVDDFPCPAIDGLKAESKANAKRTDDSLVDSVVLQGAVEVEHHEIGVYENLIINARAMGRDDVVAVLQRNLEVLIFTDTSHAAHPRRLAPPATLTWQSHASLVAGGPRHPRLHHVRRTDQRSTDP